jgi:hypothetical protein
MLQTATTLLLHEVVLEILITDSLPVMNVVNFNGFLSCTHLNRPRKSM